MNINLLNVDINNTVADFVDLIYLNSLFPVIHNPTHITDHSHTLIDNIFVSKLNPCLSGIFCIDISDHLPIIITIITSLDGVDICTNYDIFNDYFSSSINYTKLSEKLNSTI